MIFLESNCKAVVTDSGGVQKEAYFFQVPCWVLRDQTEWVELIDQGYHSLVKLGEERFSPLFQEVMGRKLDWSHALYGEGNASEKILDAILNYG